MKTTQPPITTDDELAGYRAGADRLSALMAHQARGLARACHQTPVDGERLEQMWYQLQHLYEYYRGIQNAVDAYLQHRQTRQPA